GWPMNWKRISHGFGLFASRSCRREWRASCRLFVSIQMDNSPRRIRELYIRGHFVSTETRRRYGPPQVHKSRSGLYPDARFQFGIGIQSQSTLLNNIIENRANRVFSISADGPVGP